MSELDEEEIEYERLKKYIKNEEKTSISVSEIEQEAINRIYKEMLDCLRTAENIFDKPYHDCQTMKNYEDISELTKKELDFYFETRTENLKRMLQNEVVLLSPRSYEYISLLIRQLEELSQVTRFKRVSKRNHYNPESRISYKEYDSNLTNNQMSYNFRVIQYNFFEIVKEFIYGDEVYGRIW